ncbi:MAG TPA: hypothetical protein VI456_02210 [Polyangia bacterium]
MPRRRRHDVVTLATAALALGLVGCDADVGDAGCQITQEVTLAPTPLTLLANARLDEVGDRYFLLGNDETAVRWGALDANGNLSGEQAFALPAGVTQAYYAVAGAETPGDTVLIGYLATDAASGDGELVLVAVPAANPVSTAPAAAILTFPGGAPGPMSVAMISSRKGTNAGLAWIDDASSVVQVATVNAAGALTGTPVVTSMKAAPSYSCLAFSPGKNDLTVVYYSGEVDLGQAGIAPGWVIAETSEGGSVDSTTLLAFGHPGNCAHVTPTAAGYSLAWQDTQGGWLAVYTAGAAMQPAPYPFAPASSFGGANLQPPFAGLAPFGTDYGVLLARPLDAELWRLDQTGNRRPGAVIFPSISGNLGAISALPVNGLVATYADYTSSAGASPATGGRVFLNAACY